MVNKIVRRIIIVIILIFLGYLAFVAIALNTCIIQRVTYQFKRVFTNKQVIFIGEDTISTREYKILNEIALWKYPPMIPEDTTLIMKKMLFLLDKCGYDLSDLRKDSSKIGYSISFHLYDKDMDNYNQKELFDRVHRVRYRPRFQLHEDCLYDDFYDSNTISSIDILLSPLTRKPECIELRVGVFKDCLETYAFEKILLPIEEHQDDSELSKFYYQLQQSKKNRKIEPPNIDIPEVVFWIFKDGIKHIKYERRPLEEYNKKGELRSIK